MHHLPLAVFFWSHTERAKSLLVSIYLGLNAICSPSDAEVKKRDTKRGRTRLRFQPRGPMVDIFTVLFLVFGAT